MRKIIMAVAGLLGVAVASFGVREGIDWFRREPPVSARLTTRPWVEQVLVPGSVALDVPWPLERKDLPLPPEVTELLTRSVSLTREADGLTVMASVMSFRPGTPISLDGAAEGALANVRTLAGVRSVEGSKRETTILGERAIELDAKVVQERGQPLQLRGVVVVRGDDMIQAMVTSLANQPVGGQVWKRILSSIRTPKGD